MSSDQNQSIIELTLVIQRVLKELEAIKSLIRLQLQDLDSESEAEEDGMEEEMEKEEEVPLQKKQKIVSQNLQEVRLPWKKKME